MDRPPHVVEQLVLLALLAGPGVAATPARRVTLDFDWHFQRGDVSAGEAVACDDRAWRRLDLPHDWSIEDLPGRNSPFDPEAPGGRSTGFTVGGTGWYRKHFATRRAWSGRRVGVLFEGVYMDAHVWINGHVLGRHPYGYTPFRFDLTPFLNASGRDNVLAVQVKNEGRNSRWYSGSGIYRHVWLTVTHPLHIAPNGVFVTTPRVGRDTATVRVRTEIANATGERQTVQLRSTIIGPQGRILATHVGEALTGKEVPYRFDEELHLLRPALWSPATPVLHRLRSEVLHNGEAIDRVETPFGIRRLEMRAATGLLLNGHPLLLRGGCVHHDNGPLGAAAYDRAEERRVTLLKQAGFNAVRCAHNPPSPAFLDACDRLGMLVVDEAFDQWNDAKNPEDYHRFFAAWWQRDLAAMVRRDRNHPCVILWSTGNEIPERATDRGARTARQLADFIRQLDPTRPVTAAVQDLTPDKDATFAALDVCGYNYPLRDGDAYLTDHRRLDQRILFGSESYALRALASWQRVEDYPWVLGDFVWTAFDYLGEASIGWLGFYAGHYYPWTVAYCGDLDLCGFKRPQSYYRDVVWGTGRPLSLFVETPQASFSPPLPAHKQPWDYWYWDDVHPSWTWPGHEGRPLRVHAYSACERVTLRLNGRDLGTKPTSRDTQCRAVWEVPYEPGVLTATGWRGSEQVAQWSLHTTGRPTALRLASDRPVLQADGQDLAYVTVDIVDAAGRRVINAAPLVRFAVSGAGTLAAVGSAQPDAVESFQQPKRHAFQGRCLAIVKAAREPGTLILKTTSAGLTEAAVRIETRD